MSDEGVTVAEAPKPGPTVPGETAFRQQLVEIRDIVAISSGIQDELDDPIAKAKQLVVDNYNEHRNKTRTPAMQPDFVIVLWYTGSRGNFKAVCEFTVVHGLRYEVSYNARKKEAFVDVYKKTHNIKLTDV